jgi:elongator complex protein 1
LYHLLDLTWRVDHSFGVADTDVAFVANVDGNVVGMTPFRQTVIPPPLSAFELRFEEKVRQVCRKVFFDVDQ